LPNEIIVAAAGGGKTSRIVHRAAGSQFGRTALVTYTTNNVQELHRRFYEQAPAIPAHVEIWSWYRFLLHDMVRPYQSALLSRRIEGLRYVEGQSAPFAKKSDIPRYFLSDEGRLVYSDKISELILELNRTSRGAVVLRLTQRFKRIFVDEVQDMAGYDLDLLELLMRSAIDIVLVGDHRQATFRTNNSRRNRGWSGVGIIGQFRAWEKACLASLTFERVTHRCHQAVVDLADAFFPNEPTTISKNETVTGHDGVFLVHSANVPAYVERFNPQVLRLNRTTDCGGHPAINFGDAKGLTFNRVLIYPHKKAQTWIKTGDFSHVEGSASKLYVGITRARHSVAFVFDGMSRLAGASRFD
jgi:DNA helicase II / ATP-dependent DNA helicase PcrA